MPKHGEENELFHAKRPPTRCRSQTLNAIRTATLKETTYNTNHRSALDKEGLFYIEKEENLQTINFFIKRSLMGSHLHPTDSLNRLFAELQTIGINVEDYDGGSGTYKISQYDNLQGEHPVTGNAYTDDIIFLRAKQHGNIKIRKMAVPGGLYSLDAEIYMSTKE
jgi:hypothetical protein